MAKTEVYSWRVAREVKEALEDASRERGVSMASIIEEAVAEYLVRPQADIDEDEEEHRRRWERILPFIGSINGGDPDRASQVSQRVRERLRRRHARNEV